MKERQVTVTLHPADKSGEEWVAWTGASLHRPTWNSKGAAQAYADAVNSGQRKPEFRKEGKSHAS